MVKTGIGQDSHRIVEEKENISGKPFLLAGVRFDVPYALSGNSDADVVLHTVTNAISGITGRPILGPVADRLCQGHGITDSRVYLAKALEDLADTEYRLTHVSVSIECKKPRMIPMIPRMRASLAELLGLEESDVAITATSGEELTDFGRGLGLQTFACATAIHRRLWERFQTEDGQAQ